MRLGSKFILIVAGILSVTLALNTLYNLDQQHNFHKKQLQERGRSLGHVLSMLTPELVAEFNFTRLNRYAREITRQKDVVYAAFVDIDKQPLTTYLNDKDTLVSKVLTSLPQQGMAARLRALQGAEELMPFEYPITGNESLLGYFVVGIDRRPLDLLFKQQLWLHAWIYGAIICFLSFAIYLVFRTNVLEPVLSLIQASRRVGRGEYQRVKVNSTHELGELARAFNSMTDEIQEEQHKLHYQANFDALTDLPNRMMAFDRLQSEISRASREQQQLAVMFIDLDNFKVVNDTLGHATGDQLLSNLGQRLKEELRCADMIARLGGDEFLVLLTDIKELTEVEQVAERLAMAISIPIKLENRDVVVHSSIGIAMYPDDGDSAEALMANADNAMYQAKDMTRASICFFTREMNERVQERLQMEQDLNMALELGELNLVFQPMVDAQTGKHLGAEVLLRWNHSEKGLISPDIFIPIAEATGQIIPIGRWVISQAAKCWSRWQQCGWDCGYLAINISRVQFQEQLSWIIGEMLAYHRLPAHAFELEITESVLMNDEQEVAEELQQLRAMGIKLALDDFGTGYSSLSYLKRFTFDVLKIDRSFVSGLPESEDDLSVVRAIIAMAHGLDLQVVAEGVENELQLDLLQRLDCDTAQGYLFAKPMNTDEYESYLSLIEHERFDKRDRFPNPHFS
ncbi:MAG: EAL domain-containing protein [Motiliproteus sp.]|nr:EAL domain-containing protein [Motiliproteus sp.]MCW9052908.1 EAL domain-containing protein [Motiliproteus sp.]